MEAITAKGWTSQAKIIDFALRKELTIVTLTIVTVKLIDTTTNYCPNPIVLGGYMGSIDQIKRDENVLVLHFEGDEAFRKSQIDHLISTTRGGGGEFVTLTE